MKNKFFALIAAMLIVVCVFAGCGEKEDAATPDEAVSAYATPDEVQTGTAAESTSASTAATQPTTANAKEQKPASATGETQPTTAKPVQDNIPEDTITSGNINPNLSFIQSLVIQEMNELAIRTISLDYKWITIKAGESAQLTISYDPENAVPKTCTVKSGNNCVEASIKDNKVTVKGKSEGSALITVVSYNGATASCTVNVEKVKKEDDKPAAITDDTVLPHAKVCTRQNAERWLEAVDALCAGTGMEKNTTLSGDTVSVNTADYNSDGSFNSYKEEIIADVSAQIATYTSQKYNEYEYNCILSPDGSDFKISVTLYKTEA